MKAKKARTALSDKTVDGLLKAMLVFARTVDHSLEKHAVKAATTKPLSASKVQVLRLLAQRGKQKSTQVARFLGVTKPAVSQIIDAMVRARLVTRRPATEDRREVALELTKTGKAQFAEIRRVQRQLLRRVMRGVRGHTATEWADLLSKMAMSLSQADKTFEDFCLQCGAHSDNTCILVGGKATCLFLDHAGETQKRSTRGSAKN